MSKKRNTPALKSSSKANRFTPGSLIGRIPDRWLALLMAVFGLLLYVNTLGHQYALDDYLMFVSNENVHRGIAGIPDLFIQPYRDNCYGGCFYRPLTVATFSLDWAMAPNKPLISHLINMLLYALTGAMLYLTLRRLLPGWNKALPLITCIFFLAHPVHTEVVANIKSRDEILSLLFILVSLCQWAKWHTTREWKSIGLAALAFLAALLSKEGAITMVAIFPWIGWIFFQKSFRSSVKAGAWCLVPVLIFFVLRGVALYHLSSPAIHMFDNPLVNATGTERLGTAFFILLKYLQLLVFPVRLICDYSYDAIPLQSITQPLSLMSLVIYVGMGIYTTLGLIKKQITAFFAFAFLISISLYSQLFFLIGTFIGERLLYLPSLWFMLGITAAVASWFNRDGLFRSKNLRRSPGSLYQRGILAVSAITLIWFSLQTIRRNQDWANDYTLMKADVEKSPRSIRLNKGYAEEIYRSFSKDSISKEEMDHRLTLLEEYSRQTIAIHPDIAAYNNLANICLVRRDYSGAVSNHRKIIELSEDQDIARQNIGNLLINWANEESDSNNNSVLALDLLHQAFEFKPDDDQIWFGIGLNEYKLDHFPESRAALEKAYQLAPTNDKIKTALSDFYLLQGMKDKADALK